MTTVTIRVDDETKRAAAEVAREFGFDLSSITRAFYRQVARTRRIPLAIDQPIPNDESREAMRQSDEIIARGGSGYKTVSELVDALES